MNSIEFKQYIGQLVQVSLIEGETLVQATLKGVSEYGVFLGDSKTPALTFATRFYPWTAIGYIDTAAQVKSQAA